jgi:hypothetical protein
VRGGGEGRGEEPADGGLRPSHNTMQICPNKTKSYQMKSLGFPWIPLADSGLFKGLRRIQTNFFFSRRLQIQYAPRVWLARRLGISIAAAGLIHVRAIVLGILVFRKEMSKNFGMVKALHLFDVARD